MTDQLDDSVVGDAVDDDAFDNHVAPAPGAADGGDAAGVADAGEQDAIDLGAPAQYGVGPFTIREVSIVGVWLAAFVISFLSLSPIRFESVWTAGLTWVLTIAVPTIAVFLIVLRRLSPQGIRRVGSLGIDQFASVAFSVSSALWLTYLWETVAFAVGGGPWIRSWVMWVELFLMVVGMVLTVFAPIIPVMREDFRHRTAIVAHPNARPLRPVSPRPPKPVVVPEPGAHGAAASDAGSPYSEVPYAEPASAATAYAGSGYGEAPVDEWAAESGHSGYEAPTTQFAPAHAPSEPARHQAFWALAPDEREVYDETGAPIFRIGPTAWALAIEDRGDVFVMRHEDGRIGYLHDVTGVTRG